MMVSIVIVNYNTRDLTVDCLHSIYNTLIPEDFEIILVDNASQDDSVEKIKASFPKALVIESDTNLGFGRANNLGVKHAKGEYVWFLNSDTIVRNNAIKYFREFIAKEVHLNIGCLGSILKDRNMNNGSSYGDFIHPFHELAKTVYQPFVRSNTEVLDLNKINKTSFFEVDWISGASFFMRKDVFDRVGGFDPYFFMYSEEVDLHKRLSKLGYKHYIVSGPDIVHLEGGSGKKASHRPNTQKIFTAYDSQLYYVKNNYGGFTYSCYKAGFYMINILKIAVSRKYNLAEKRDVIKKLIKR